jgi:hypothetical protein
MVQTRCARRILIGLGAVGIALGPLVAVAAAQDTSEPEPVDLDAVREAWDFYAGELLGADLDGDGVFDVVDSDGDGVPDIPQGEPGDRDITPASPLFLDKITADLEALGLDTIVEADSGSKLLGDCGGMALSYDGDGKLIDLAVGVPSNEGGGPNGAVIDFFGDGYGERAFTSGNPFQVDTTVVYIGTLPRDGDGPREHNWTIKTSGISLDKGGDPNENGKNRNAGEVDLDSVPTWLRPAGIFPVEANLTSQNDLSCTAEGWIKFQGGNPFVSVPSAVAAALGVTGLVGLLFNARPAITWKA